MRWILGLLVGLAGCQSCRKQSVAVMADAAPPAVATSVASVVVTPAPRLPLAFELESARLLASGHVLVSGWERGAPHLFWDWDATAPDAEPVRIDLGDGDAEPILAGDSFFLVLRTNKEDTALELWDVATHSKKKDLGVWKKRQTSHSVSEDGKRLVFAACLAEDAEYETCDVTIHALPSGAVLQRVSLPKLHFERYFASFPQSPSGRYFALDHQNLDVGVWDARSNEKVYGNPEHEHGERLVWLGDEKVVTETDYGGQLHVHALADGAETATVDFKLAKHESAHRPTMSPDRARIATDLKLFSGVKIAVTNVADGKTTKYPIPKSVCPEYCDFRWVDDHTIEVHASSAAVDRPPTRARLDATTGAITIASPPPSFAEGGFEVYWADDCAADELADGGGKKDVVVTTLGKRLAFEPHRRGRAETTAGRLLLTSTHFLRVIDGDGTVSELGDKDR